MYTRLTLRLDASLIQRAKAHAAARGTFVSQLVALYFAALDPDGQPRSASDEKLPPVTRSLYGRLAGADVDEDAYHRRLQEKHR